MAGTATGLAAVLVLPPPVVLVPVPAVAGLAILRNTATGVPAATVPVAGICVAIVPLGFGGCGDTAPSIRPAARNVVSAVTGGRPTTFGTLTLLDATATVTSTDVPFLTLLPAAGAWAMIEPGRAPGACLSAG